MSIKLNKTKRTRTRLQARAELRARGYIESPDGTWTLVQGNQVTYARIKSNGKIQRFLDTSSFERYGGRKRRW